PPAKRKPRVLAAFLEAFVQRLLLLGDVHGDFWHGFVVFLGRAAFGQALRHGIAPPMDLIPNLTPQQSFESSLPAGFYRATMTGESAQSLLAEQPPKRNHVPRARKLRRAQTIRSKKSQPYRCPDRILPFHDGSWSSSSYPDVKLPFIVSPHPCSASHSYLPQ